MKKKISLLIVITFIVSIVSTMGLKTSAATYDDYTGSCGVGLTYNLDTETGVLTIDGSGNMANYASVNDVPWYDVRNYIKTVELAENVTSIGRFAFSGCTNLERVKAYNSSQMEIAEYAFSTCTNLKVFEGTACGVGDYAFENCTKLKSFFMQNFWSAGSNIGMYAFYGCTSLEELSIPYNPIILNYAFEGCSNLRTIYINKIYYSHPDTVAAFSSSNISTYAFQGVKANVFYPEKMPGIYSDMESKFGGTLTWIAKNYGTCGYDSKWTFESETGTLTIYGSGSPAKYYSGSYVPWAAYRNQIKHINVEKGIVSLPSYIFEYCTEVETIALPEGMLSVASNAFNDCANVNNIIFPSTIEKFGVFDEFIRCSKLTDIYYVGTNEEWNMIVSTPTNVTVHTLVWNEPGDAETQPGYYSFDNTTVYDYIYNENKERINALVISNGKTIYYGRLADAIASANEIGAVSEIVLKGSVTSTSVEFDYKHTLDLGNFTITSLEVIGDAVIKNGTITNLNVIGLTETENVTVTNTDAVSYGVNGTKGVYTSYAKGTNMYDGAQVRIGGGVDETGAIDSESGLRFIAQSNLNDSLAGIILTEHFNDGVYDEGYEIGIDITAEDSENTVSIPALKWNSDASVFSAAITKLASGNFNRNYTAKAYVIYDGVKFVDESSTTRSMYSVAAGLLNQSGEEDAEKLVDVLNAYVNQTGIRLLLTSDGAFYVNGGENATTGAYIGESFFTVGEATKIGTTYYVGITPVGINTKIDTENFAKYIRINNNNSQIKSAVTLTDNEDGTYTLTLNMSKVG